MFGTIKPQKGNITKEQYKEYKKYYCGLCFAMGENFGDFSRLFINFDLTNDFLLAGAQSLNKFEKEDTCPWSIRKKKIKYYEIPILSDYFAKLNYIFVYHKLMDDVYDDGSIRAKIITHYMKEHISAIEQEMSAEINDLYSYLSDLKEIEQQNKLVPIFEVASLFGTALKKIVTPPTMDQEEKTVFSEINYWVGVWIYTMDAILDCLNDGLKKRYNPIIAGLNGSPLFLLRSRKEELIDILKTSRKNILDLVSLYSDFEHRELILNLFAGDLDRIVCLYLGVEKNVLKT